MVSIQPISRSAPFLGYVVWVWRLTLLASPISCIPVSFKLLDIVCGLSSIEQFLGDCIEFAPICFGDHVQINTTEISKATKHFLGWRQTCVLCFCVLCIMGTLLSWLIQPLLIQVLVFATWRNRDLIDVPNDILELAEVISISCPCQIAVFFKFLKPTTKRCIPVRCPILKVFDIELPIVGHRKHIAQEAACLPRQPLVLNCLVVNDQELFFVCVLSDLWHHSILSCKKRPAGRGPWTSQRLGLA